jgi:hypothetical protein
MDFSPDNHVVQLCMQAIDRQSKGEPGCRIGQRQRPRADWAPQTPDQLLKWRERLATDGGCVVCAALQSVSLTGS